MTYSLWMNARTHQPVPYHSSMASRTGKRIGLVGPILTQGESLVFGTDTETIPLLISQILPLVIITSAMTMVIMV